jgi:Protein CHAPERONE-LIKE PROTEIN OF POR1-like
LQLQIVKCTENNELIFRKHFKVLGGGGKSATNKKIMSQPNPYARLGIDESASFEEIQAAKQRLQKEHSNDPQLAEAIEAAYDSILMERLKMRQEGKIQIPEGIRYPEKEKSIQTLSLPKLAPPQLGNAADLVELPSRRNLAIGSALMSVLAVGAALPTMALGNLPTLMVVAVGYTVVSLRAKSNRLGRAFAITGLGLIAAIGLSALAVDVGELPTGQLGGARVAALVTILFMWLLTAFVK